MSSRVKQSKDDLKQNLVGQINFLITSSRFYDEGDHLESKRIAVTLRILFHDTKRCRSLLSQLSLKNYQWVDTATPYDPNNLVSHVGLISIKFDCPSGRVPWLTPKGTPIGSLNKSQFNKWWGNPVIVAVKDSKKRYFSRKDIILNVANTDGGAHVDPGLEENYIKLSRKNIIGFTAFRNSIEYPMINPELPCIRQISHEVLLTLQSEVPEFFSQSYDGQIKSGPYGISKETGPPTVTPVEIFVSKF